jgi:hypothetical protein
MHGNIVLNNSTYYGAVWDQVPASTRVLRDNIFWGNSGGFQTGEYENGETFIAPTYDIQRLTSGNNNKSYDHWNNAFDHAAVYTAPTDGLNGAGTGISIAENRTVSFQNSLLYGNPSYGAADYAQGNYNAYYGNGAARGGSHTPSAGANDITSHDAIYSGSNTSGSIKWLPKGPESGSVLATAGSSSGKIGAEVMWKIGVDGTLYGETGWDTVRSPANGYGGASDRLWPFPNETQIKSDMSAYSGGGLPGARGFATGTSMDGTVQSLTKYIWEAAGNQAPADYYDVGAVNGACGVNSGGTFSALTYNTAGNCSAGTVASFTGTGPWTWGCDGSGGGTSTSSTACSASLASDSTAPNITAFDMPTTANSTTVSVSTFTATDDVGVTGYCITTTNSSAGCSWSGSAPTTATGVEGANTFYAWAKDAANNVSSVSTDTTTITVPACTYYVRPDGNDSNTGSTNTSGGAWLTLQKASNTMTAGQTTCVADGTYVGFFVETTGTAGNPITFKALGTGANINMPNWRSGTERLDGINIESYGTPSSYITIDGFRVYNQPRMGIRAIDGTGIIIQNCTTYDNTDTGIFSANTPAIQVLNNNTYENGTTQYQHNIYISNAASDSPVIRGNTIRDSNAGNGLHVNGDWLEGGDGYIDNAIIENNLVYGNAAKGLSLTSIRSGIIRNNIIYNNGGAGGIHIVEQQDSHYSSDNIVVNNTIDEPSVAAVRVNSGNTGNVIFNNIAIGATGIVFEGTGNYQSNNYSASSGGSSIFTNYAGHNYTLLSTSPAKEYGTASYQSESAPTTDYLGNVRPSGSGYDAGAYEYQSQAGRRCRYRSVSGD